MKLLYLDCFAGISGDMFLGALLDLGVSEDKLRAELAKLNLPGYHDLDAARGEAEHFGNEVRLRSKNITSIRAELRRSALQHMQHEHRGYAEIAAMIDEASALAESVKRRALSVFRRIGEAEAKIHGMPLEKIHFHEIGAVDSIVDIVGACVAVEMLGVDEVQASPPRLGSGFVDTAHGRFPIPAPATLELLKGVPTQPSSEPVELVTPTGRGDPGGVLHPIRPDARDERRKDRLRRRHARFGKNAECPAGGLGREHPPSPRLRRQASTSRGRAGHGRR